MKITANGIQQIIEMMGRKEMIDQLITMYQDSFCDIDQSEREQLLHVIGQDSDSFFVEMTKIFGKRLPDLVINAVEEAIDCLRWIYRNFVHVDDFAHEDADGWYLMATGKYSAVLQYEELLRQLYADKHDVIARQVKQAAILYKRIHDRHDADDELLYSMVRMIDDGISWNELDIF